jgi:hypothetical protein
VAIIWDNRAVSCYYSSILCHDARSTCLNKMITVNETDKLAPIWLHHVCQFSELLQIQNNFYIVHSMYYQLLIHDNCIHLHIFNVCSHFCFNYFNVYYINFQNIQIQHIYTLLYKEISTCNHLTLWHHISCVQKWVIWFYTVLLSFDSLLMVHADQNMWEYSVWYYKHVRKMYVHFVSLEL